MKKANEGVDALIGLPVLISARRAKSKAGAAEYAPERLLIGNRNRRFARNIMLMAVYAAAAAALVHLNYRADFRAVGGAER
jgi:hypothetical protein